MSVPKQRLQQILHKSRNNPAISALTPSLSFVTIYSSDLSADPRMINHKRLDDALAIYRLFKECRNSLAHAGGKANDRVEQWSNDVETRAADLFVRAQGGKAIAPKFVKGDLVAITIDQMRAFVSLLLRVVFTIDAALLTSTQGEAEFLRCWSGKFGNETVKVKRKKLNRGVWASVNFASIGLPIPTIQTDLIAYLLGQNLVRDIP